MSFATRTVALGAASIMAVTAAQVAVPLSPAFATEAAVSSDRNVIVKDYEDGARLLIPAEWKKGEKLVIQGRNFLKQDKTPSKVVFKIDKGGLTRTDNKYEGSGIWAEATADANGTFSVELDWPTAANSNAKESDWELGKAHDIFALTGADGVDYRRGGVAASGVKIAAPAGEATATTEKSYADGAKVEVANEWVAGKPLVVKGSGFLTKDGKPSRIAFKIDNGAVYRTDGSAEKIESVQDITRKGLWQAVDANADGTFEIALDFPTETNAAGQNIDTKFAPGSSHKLMLLTGSLVENDHRRGGIIVDSLKVLAPTSGNPGGGNNKPGGQAGDSDGSSTGAIVGGVVGALALIAAIAAVVTQPGMLPPAIRQMLSI